MNEIVQIRRKKRRNVKILKTKNENVHDTVNNTRTASEKTIEVKKTGQAQEDDKNHAS